MSHWISPSCNNINISEWSQEAPVQTAEPLTPWSLKPQGNHSTTTRRLSLYYLRTTELALLHKSLPYTPGGKTLNVRNAQCKRTSHFPLYFPTSKCLLHFYKELPQNNGCKGESYRAGSNYKGAANNPRHDTQRRADRKEEQEAEAGVEARLWLRANRLLPY